MPSVCKLAQTYTVHFTIFIQQATILFLTNIDAVLAEVVVVAIDLLNAGQSLAFNVVCKAAFFVDPAFLQDVDQGILVGDLCIGIAEVTACIVGISGITVGIHTKHCLVFRLLSEAVQAAGAHVDLIADSTGGHGVDLGSILPHTSLGSQLDALDEAQGICGCLVNNLALLDPMHGHSQRIGGFIKLDFLHFKVVIQDVQFTVINIETIIEVNGCLNPGQVTDTLCQAGQEGPCIAAFHSAAGQHVCQLFQTLRDRNRSHIQCKDIRSNHILVRINDVVDAAILDLRIGDLTVPSQLAVTAGSLIKIEAVFTLLIQHDVDGSSDVFIDGSGDGHRLDCRFNSIEGKAVHGTCCRSTQSDGHIIGVDCNGLAAGTSAQGQSHAGTVNDVDLCSFEVQLIGIGQSHQLAANHLIIQHQIDSNFTQTLAGEDTVFSDGCPVLIADCPGSTLGNVHSVASRADTGSSHLYSSTDGCIVVLALYNCMVKCSGAGSSRVNQQIGRNVTGVAVGGTVHNSQLIAAGLTCHEGGGAATVQVDCNDTASFLHDVAHILQASARGEGSLTTVDTHQNDTAGSSDTNGSTRSIALGGAAGNLAVLHDEFTEAADCFLNPILHGCILCSSTHVSGAVIQDCKEACGTTLRMPLNAVHNHQATGSCDIRHVVTTSVGGCNNIEVLDVVLAGGIAVAVLCVLSGAGNRIVLPLRILGSTGIAVIVVNPQANIVTQDVRGCNVVNDLVAIRIGCVVDLLGNTGSQDLGISVENSEAGVGQVFDIVTGDTAHFICKGIADCLTQFSQIVAGSVEGTGTFQSCDQLIAGVSIVHSSTQILTSAQTIQSVGQQIADTLLQRQTGLEVFSQHLFQITGLITLGDQLVHDVVGFQVSVQVVAAKCTGGTSNLVAEQVVVADICNLFFQSQAGIHAKLIRGTQQVSQVTDPTANVSMVLATLVVVGHIHGTEEMAAQDRQCLIGVEIRLTMCIGIGLQLLQTRNIDPDINFGIRVNGIFCILNILQECLILGACHNGPGTGGIVCNSGTHVVQHQTQRIGTGILQRILLSHCFQIAQVSEELIQGCISLDLHLGDLSVALGMIATVFTGIVFILIQGLDGLTHQTVVMCSPTNGTVSCLLGISVHPAVIQSRNRICIIVTVHAVFCAFLMAVGIAGCRDLHVSNDPVMIGHRSHSLSHQNFLTEAAVRAFGQTGFSTGCGDCRIDDCQMILLGVKVSITAGTCSAVILAGVDIVPVVAQSGDDFLGNPELVTLLALPAGGHAILSTGCRNFFTDRNTEMLLAVNDLILGTTQRTGVNNIRSRVTAVDLVGFALVPDVAVGIDGQIHLGSVVTARAVNISLPASFLTGSRLCLMLGFVVAQSGDLHIGGVIAARAGHISFPTDFGTGNSLCLIGSLIMTQSGDDPAVLFDLMLASIIAKVVFAGRAVAVAGVAIFSTGLSLCFDNGEGADVFALQNGDLSILVLLCMTDRALLVLDTGFLGGCFLIGDPLPDMAGSFGLRISVAVTTVGTGVGSEASFRTGRCGHNGFVVMTQSSDLCIGSVIAVRTGHVCIPANFGTGSSPSLVVHFIMSHRSNFHISGVIAARAGHISFPTNCGTGGSLSLVAHFIVAQRFNSLINVAGATVLTGISGEATLRTGGRSHNCYIVMHNGPDTINLLETNRTSKTCCFGISTIGVHQLCGGDGNFEPFVILIIRSNILNLIGLRIRFTGLHDDGAGTGNLGATSSGVDKACRKIGSTVNFHIGILVSANNSLCRGGITKIDICSVTSTAEGRTFVIARICIRNPLIVVVNIDAITAAQGTGCALCNDQFRTRLQSDILSHMNGTTVLHGDGHVAVDGQDIVLGIDGLGAEQTQLHGHGKALDAERTINIDLQSASLLLIILNDISAVNIEHTIGTDKGNCSFLNTNKRNVNRHIALFSCTGFQRHGNFHILHIVLGEGEDSVVVIDHTGSVVTAAPVHNLEALIDRCAALDSHSTTALDETPGIQITAAIDRNGTVRFHLNKAGSTHRRALTTTRSLCCRKAQGTINDDMRTFCHRQSTISSRGGIGRFSRLRCSSAHSISSIKGNQQRDIAGDGVLTCRQGTIVGQDDGLICNCPNCRNCSIQVLIQGVAIDQETGICGKDSLNSHIICRLQRKASILGQQEVRLSIDPSQESRTIGSYSIQNCTGAGDIHRRISLHSITIYSNATHSAVILEGYQRRFLYRRTSKVSHHQLIFGAILRSRDRNHKGRTSFQNLLKFAAVTTVHGTVNLQFIDRGGSPVKGNICFATTFIVNGDSCGLRTGTNTQNTLTALCSNSNSTIGHGVIGGTRNANRHTSHGGMAAAGRSHGHNKHGFKDILKAIECLHIHMRQYIRSVDIRQRLYHCQDLSDLGNDRLVDRPRLSIDSLLDLVVGHIGSNAVDLQDGIHPIR